MSMIAIVPRLPPAIDGVGDFALRLATQFSQDFGVTTQFIVADPDWTGASELEGMSAQAVSDRATQPLLDLLNPSVSPTTQPVVLLHYVPHGYARKACPFWLVEALKQWRQQSNGRLLTFFHELYALDWHRPWSSDFWLSPVQQHLAACLSQLSDRCLTSTERYIGQIQQLSRGKQTDVPLLPIFSNVGEPAAVMPLAKRQRTLIIFGQPHSKGGIYNHETLLQTIGHALGIEQILDIGPQTGLAPSAIDKIPVQELGELPASDISQLLSQSLAGFLAYDPRRLSKSGIFAAYCAHGLLPINHQSLPIAVDGLEAGIHYWAGDRASTLNLEIGQTIADQAHTWYQQHSIQKHAQTLYRCLSSDGWHEVQSAECGVQSAKCELRTPNPEPQATNHEPRADQPKDQ